MTTPGGPDAPAPKPRRPLWVWLLVGVGLALVFVPVGTIQNCYDGDSGGYCTTTYVSVVGMVTGIGYNGF